MVTPRASARLSDEEGSIVVRDFTKRFATLSHQRPQVIKRGRVVGTWLPAPKPVDVMKRVKRHFDRSLPFTGADVLKSGKKR